MGKLRKACANCIKYKLACEAKRPCARCILHQCDCIDVERKPRTVKKKGIKRSKFDTVEKLHSMCFPPAQPLSHFPQIQDTPTNPPFIPELVTIDSFPIQDTSVVPAADYGFMLSNSLLSAMGPPYANSYEASNIIENPVEASDKSPNKSPLYVNTPPQVPSTPITPASVAMNPANKITMPFPQPLMVVEKKGCKIMDCNPELVQFLGYNSLAEFNSCVHGLEDVLVTDESRPFDLSPIKIGNFEKLATVKSVTDTSGVGRPVIFNVSVMQNLVIFTVKEVFEVKQLCSYSRWLKMMMPNAIITPSCEHANCQCKFFDMLLNTGAPNAMRVGDK